MPRTPGVHPEGVGSHLSAHPSPITVQMPVLPLFLYRSGGQRQWENLPMCYVFSTHFSVNRENIELNNLS